MAGLLGTIFSFLLAVVPVQAASSYQVLHSFTGKDGEYPTAGLISDASGHLYGTTSGFSNRNHGTVFKLSGAGGKWTRTVLHYFTGKDDGCGPLGGLIFDAAGNLYGTTSGCGASGQGTVFELSPGGNGKWKLTVLHSFGVSDHLGYSPYAGLIFDTSGNLYGTTFQGGIHGLGTVFELAPRANGKWLSAALHAFGNAGDGAEPMAGLVFDAAGNLYGTTFTGGPRPADAGTVFKLSKGLNGWKETILYKFCSLQNCTDGSQPQASLVLDKAGNLYGTTAQGGLAGGCSDTNGCGTVFRLTPAKGQWKETVLYVFKGGSDGATPLAGLIFDAAGNLYGTTEFGGNLTCSTFGCGTVFKLSRSRQWTETVLHAFFGKDGDDPTSGLIFDGTGNLYGTTFGGGAFAVGTVFKLTP
jgi:uncharacterized repeat protein (TIGR03803 family)